MRSSCVSFLFIFISLSGVYGQKKFTIDSDVLLTRDSLEGKEMLLTSITRGDSNPEAIWIQYNRRPGVDPWSKDSRTLYGEAADKSFITYMSTQNIDILGALTTYDPCLCGKNKSMLDPDMYIINFKISPSAWQRLQAIYKMKGAEVIR